MLEERNRIMKALIVGCGLVGSIVARGLAEAGYDVLVIERRNHVGGNLYDYIDEHGILVQKYGPHTFHTNKKNLYDVIAKYTEWQPYTLVCGAVIDGQCVPTAFNYKAVDTFFDKEKANEIKRNLETEFKGRESVTVVEMLECKNSIVREFAQFLYDKDYSLYTAKQWGVKPEEIDKSVLKRVPIRLSYEEAYFKDKYQVMPRQGFSVFISQVLNHPRINVELSTDATKILKIENKKVLYKGLVVDYPVIYTGPVDELFGYANGKLPYRSLRFEWEYEAIDSKQEMPVVAYPQVSDFTRITEYKKLPIQKVEGTSYAVEYPVPFDAENHEMEPYYPVLTEESQAQYMCYKKQADTVKNLYLCGRLAEFKYYNMDQALERALDLLENTWGIKL